jgi:putative membrane protein
MGAGWGSGLMGGWNGWWFGLHGLGMLLFWGLLILAIVLLVRAAMGWSSPQAAAGSGGAGSGADPALLTLRERFARGELNREEFDSMREALR